MLTLSFASSAKAISSRVPPRQDRPLQNGSHSKEKPTATLGGGGASNNQILMTFPLHGLSKAHLPELLRRRTLPSTGEWLLRVAAGRGNAHMGGR